MRAFGWRPWSWKCGWTECSVLCAGSRSSPRARKWSSLWHKPLVSSKLLSTVYGTDGAHVLYSQLVHPPKNSKRIWASKANDYCVMRNPQVHKKVLGKSEWSTNNMMKSSSSGSCAVKSGVSGILSNIDPCGDFLWYGLGPILVRQVVSWHTANDKLQ